jgi:HNH endonuclease
MTAPLSRFSTRPYIDRFGNWSKALEKFIEVANQEPTEAELNPSMDSSEPISDSETNPNTNQEIVNEVKAVESKPKMSIRVEGVFKHKTKRDINLQKRWKVFNRDNFKCVSCGRSPAKDPNVELHVDHIKPWSKGGETVLENLQTLCATCNLGKSNIE